MSRTHNAKTISIAGFACRNKCCRLSAGFAILLATTVSMTSTSQAATYTWNVAGGGDWNTAGNWTSVPATGTAPQNGNNTVIINASGGTITGNPAGGDDKFRFLTFDNGTIQDHDRANADNVGTWTIGDGNAGNGSANFQFSGNGTFRGGTFNIQSDGNLTASNVIIGHVSSNAPGTVNINGGIVTASGNLQFSNYQGTVNLNGGSLNITGDALFVGGSPATRTISVAGGSLTADEFTVNGWDAGEDMVFNVTGSNASLIQFRQWNIDENGAGSGSLSYTLVTGQTITPISLTDAANPFGGNASNFINNFTLSIDGSGVDNDFDSNLVLFRLTNAAGFDGLNQLRFSDLLGTSFRTEGDLISVATPPGQADYLLHFNALRAGNLSGDLEVWLENYVAPVPEPSSFVLLGLGLLALRKRKRHLRV